jgi:hypothetical protein
LIFNFRFLIESRNANLVDPAGVPGDGCDPNRPDIAAGSALPPTNNVSLRQKGARRHLPDGKTRPDRGVRPNQFGQIVAEILYT